MRTLLSLALLASGVGALIRAETPIPRLQAQGTATQLIVDGRPFLVRGGEINNSSATNPAYLEPQWAKLKALNLNTLIVPIYWDLIEPQEGTFDFSTVDRTVAQARANGMRLVLLWFGSWKNSMSCYAPAWIKRDPVRFPRAVDLDGNRLEILSPFSTENQRTDSRAFAAVMHHLRETDSTARTVVLVQVENEIGMIPSARDHSPAAELTFGGPVPPELIQALVAGGDRLTPELKAAWQGAGGKRVGTWAEVFGQDDRADEIFMAWFFARYTNAVTAAGKQEYPLPMYVNAALIRPGYRPGQYPSAGPLPHLIDVWRAGAPAIDFLAPDIYFQNFAEWTRRYKLPGNPLFIPESLRNQDASVNGLYAYGAHDALGFAPFGIETMGEAAERYMSASFDLIAQLEPTILAHQGDGSMAGLLPEGPEQKLPLQVRLGGYTLSVTFEKGVPPSLADGAIVPTGREPITVPPSGGLVIATGSDEFIFAGTAISITFTRLEPGAKAGIASAEEGRFVNGVWRNTLWLGGDQTHQGRHIRLEPGRFSIQRVKLYRY